MRNNLKLKYTMIHLTCLLLSVLMLHTASCYSMKYANEKPVGQIGPKTYITPVHQVLTPAGIQVQLPGLRPQAVALSPDGSLLAASGKTRELILVNPETGDIKQRVALPSRDIKTPPLTPSDTVKPDRSGQLSFTGLVFSRDGKRIYLSNVNGDIKVFNVSDTGQVTGSYSIELPNADAPGRKQAIPAGIAISENGKLLYAALNLSNRLVEIEIETSQILRTWDVGVAPYDVVLKDDKA